LAETSAAAELRISPLEDPELVVLTWVLLSPVSEEIEKLVCPGGIGVSEVVEITVSPVHLIIDEALAIIL
jgi:hypothetical protein